MRSLILAVALLAASTAAARAQSAICQRPPVPACAENELTFLNAKAMIECQNEMRVYLEAMPKYQECLRQEQIGLADHIRSGIGQAAANADEARMNQLRDEQLNAGRELVSVAKVFNCRLMKQPNCR